jgi:hypothetical protein
VVSLLLVIECIFIAFFHFEEAVGVEEVWVSAVEPLFWTLTLVVCWYLRRRGRLSARPLTLLNQTQFQTNSSLSSDLEEETIQPKQTVIKLVTWLRRLRNIGLLFAPLGLSLRALARHAAFVTPVHFIIFHGGFHLCIVLSMGTFLSILKIEDALFSLPPTEGVLGTPSVLKNIHLDLQKEDDSDEFSDGDTLVVPTEE